MKELINSKKKPKRISDMDFACPRGMNLGQSEDEEETTESNSEDQQNAIAAFSHFLTKIQEILP